MMRLLAIFATACLLAQGLPALEAVAQEAEPKLPPGIPIDAVFAALDDAQAIDAQRPGIARWTRYIFLRSGDDVQRKALGTAVNSSVYRSAVVKPLATVSAYVVRLDLFEGKGDLRTWERLAPATVFHLQTALQLADCEPYKASDGKTYSKRWVQKIEPSPAVLPHLAALANLTGSQVPIVEASYFVVRALSAVDHGYGPGLLYEFIGVKKSTERGLSDQDVFLRDFFAINLKDIRKRLADARVAIAISNVAENARAVEVVQGASHLRTSGGEVWISHDLFEADRAVKRDAFRQLLDFIDRDLDRAREIMFPLANGHIQGILFNSKGELQTAVPPNIATWDGVPAGHVAQLVAGIACLECHHRGESENGLKNLGNDVYALYRAGKGPLADLADPEHERLKSGYGGDLDEALANARRGYVTAVFRSSGGLTPQEAYKAIYELWSELLYQDVTPEVACYRLAIEVDGRAEAIAVLDRIEGQMKVRDPYAGLLSIGTAIGGRDWSNIEADLLVIAEAMRGAGQ